MWNRSLKAWKYGKEPKQKYTHENISKTEEIKIRVSRLVHMYAWTIPRADSQACICSIDLAHVGFYLETLKKQQTEQHLKHKF